MEAITVLRISPGCRPEKIKISHTLEAMQAVVDGSIQAIYPFEDPVALICNEEGKLLGMTPNRVIRDPNTKEIVEIICGTFFICGLGREDFDSLTEQQLQYYTRLFEYPEIFYGTVPNWWY